MKKGLFIGLIVVGCIVLVVGILIAIKLIKGETICDSISGGAYNLFFETNSEIEISNMHVCIACPPDVYEDLPIPEREGYTFEGWYYDKKLTKKVNVTSSLDITPVPLKVAGCVKGYKDITLYAKWEKEEE